MPVGRRSRPRAGRARSDAQRATGVGPGDRPAAGADGVQVEHRQRDRAPADEASGRLPRGAVLDHADVARRAAHVEAQRAALAARERRPGGAGGAARGPGEHRQGGMVARLLERGEAAGGLHHVRRRQARVSRARGDRRQVVGQQRRERRIELGRRGALVLAERAHDLVRERDVHAGQPLSQRRAQRLLVRRVTVGVQQADGHRSRLQRADGIGEPGRVRERAQHAVGPHALGRADPPLRWDERRRMRGAEAVEVGARLAPELDEVLEALGRDEHRARSAALEQRVGRDGRAVREGADVLRSRSRPFQRGADGGEHALGLVLRSGRRLGADQSPVDCQDGVGERSSDVDPEEHQAASVTSSVSPRCWCDGQ